MPIGNLLVGMRKREHSRFAEAGSGDLQAHGHAILGEAAGYGDRRQTQHIEHMRVANLHRRPVRRQGWIQMPDSMLIGAIAVVGVTSKSTLENALSASQRRRSISRRALM